MGPAGSWFVVVVVVYGTGGLMRNPVQRAPFPSHSPTVPLSDKQCANHMHL